jgi:hypothetical protein
MNSSRSNDYVITVLLIFTLINGLKFEEMVSGMEPQCNTIIEQLDYKTLICDNFETFNELDFTKTNNQEFNKLEIIVKEDVKLSLNDDLNLAGFKFVLNNKTIPKILIENINNGIDWRSLVLTNHFSNNIQIDIEIKRTTFWSSNQILSNIECQQATTPFIFSNLNINELKIVEPNFDLNDPICPLIFSKSVIKTFLFYSVMEEMTFIDIQQDLNTIQVNHLLIHFCDDPFVKVLDNRLLNPILFKGFILFFN